MPGAKKTEREVKKPAKASKRKRKSAFSVKQGLLLAKNMLKAIRIKRLWIDWDTGDFVVNAWLFPLVRLLNRRNVRFRINFIGNQEINIFLQTRLSRLGWAFLRTFLHHKK